MEKENERINFEKIIKKHLPNYKNIHEQNRIMDAMCEVWNSAIEKSAKFPDEFIDKYDWQIKILKNKIT